MPASSNPSSRPPSSRPGAPAWVKNLRYWLPWLLLLAALALGIHAYLNYRTRELDKRLEQINIGFKINQPIFQNTYL